MVKNCPENDFTYGGRLWPLVETCAASFIMYFPDLLNKYSSQNLLVQRFDVAIQKFQISIEEIRSWSQEIRDSLRQSINVVSPDDSPSEIVISSCLKIEQYLENSQVI